MVETKPEIICICGSMRHFDEILKEFNRLTMEKKIVLIPVPYKDKDDASITIGEMSTLFEMHCRRIDMSDKVLVVNPDDYIGDDTYKDIKYAESVGKPIEYRYFHDRRND